ncbi:alpha/beta hydrolase [Streptomyces sp. NPDC002564]|uniref:alpha/beta hydrolase n=1 Tax=Streptomyces sp. NPDC002564 TaxID=3364649 RepID=UPI0036761FA8
MSHRAPRRRLLPLLALGATVALTPGLVGATASAAPRPHTAPATDRPGTAGTAPAPPDRFTRQTPDWHRCGADTPAAYQCATLKVPLDHRAPGGATLDLAISRIEAGDPERRRGVLLSNPGGPGGVGLDLPLYFAEQMPEAVTDRYDLIGFDPRGVGASSPVNCGLTESERQWPRNYRPFDRNVAWARTVADKCREKAGATLAHLTTRNTARDMDILRAVLGEKKISYFGVSYGTALGAVYAQLFPGRADRFVLDSAVDPKLMWRDMFRVWAPEVEPAFRRWARWTAAHAGRYDLGRTPAEVRATFWGLVERADRDPIVVGDAKLTGADVRAVLRREFFTVRGAAELVGVLRDAAAGKPVPEFPTPPEIPDNGVSALWAVVCGDAASPRDPGRYLRDSVRDAARYPLFGDFASNITPCAFWDAPVEPLTRVDNEVGTLILQNEWDSQTPLSAARGMHRALKGSRMVTVDEGEGHGVAYGMAAGPANRCAQDTATSYLVTGRLPGKDVTCRATPGTGRGEAAHPVFG